MKFNPTRFIVIDKDGKPKFPTEITERFYWSPEGFEQAENGDHEIRYPGSLHHLARVYIEPTNRCNLECLTCIRNVWDEPLGMMQWETFEHILNGIQAFVPVPTVFLGGFGEPLVHPGLLEMIKQVKDTGGKVELITNGILLSEDVTEQLIEANLDILWISIDGMTPESYADVRLGATLPVVLENLDTLLRKRDLSAKKRPRVGIAFVAMRRNIHELQDLLTMGTIKGIDLFSISNVLAYTPQLKEEVLYERTLIGELYPSAWKDYQINFPRMDKSIHPLETLSNDFQIDDKSQLSRHEAEAQRVQCPFLLKGSISIRWDGEVSPCLPLMHTHDSYLGKRLRRSHSYSIGNILDYSLPELWNKPEYIALRRRLQAFDFSPCTYCNSCELADENIEDCFGNRAPGCGGCLWAQGLIQCP